MSQLQLRKGQNMLEAFAMQAALSTPLPAELWHRIFCIAVAWPPNADAAARTVWPILSGYAVTTTKRWERFATLPEAQRNRAITGFVRGWLAKTHALVANLAVGGVPKGVVPTASLLVELEAWADEGMDEQIPGLSAECQWEAADLEGRLAALVRVVCACAARRQGAARSSTGSLQIAQWPSKRIPQLAATLLICLRLDERIVRGVPATTRAAGDVVSNEEIDRAIRQVVAGKPDCPAIRRFMQGLRLFGGVLLPGFQPALRLDLRPLRRLHTHLMLMGWVTVGCASEECTRGLRPFAAIDSHLGNGPFIFSSP